MKFSIKDFYSKRDQIRRKLRIWSHLLQKSLMGNFIFCAGENNLLVCRKNYQKNNAETFQRLFCTRNKIQKEGLEIIPLSYKPVYEPVGKQTFLSRNTITLFTVSRLGSCTNSCNLGDVQLHWGKGSILAFGNFVVEWMECVFWEEGWPMGYWPFSANLRVFVLGLAHADDRFQFVRRSVSHANELTTSF